VFDRVLSDDVDDLHEPDSRQRASKLVMLTTWEVVDELKRVHTRPALLCHDGGNIRAAGK
jgi:hypothetical protein